MFSDFADVPVVVGSSLVKRDSLVNVGFGIVAALSRSLMHKGHQIFGGGQ